VLKVPLNCVIAASVRDLRFAKLVSSSCRRNERWEDSPWNQGDLLPLPIDKSWETAYHIHPDDEIEPDAHQTAGLSNRKPAELGFAADLLPEMAEGFPFGARKGTSCVD
jgi:hypothetical protein